jgi:methylglyoxal synthase
MAQKSLKYVSTVFSTPKKTSIATADIMVKKSSMNKNKRRSYKAYRGQGK